MPGQAEATVTVQLVTNGYATGAELTRALGSWIADGFASASASRSPGSPASGRSSTLDANSLLLGSGAADPERGQRPDVGHARHRRCSGRSSRTTSRSSATTPITIVGGDFGGYVTRTDGLSWTADGFQEGQLVMIQGLEGAWRLRRIESSGTGTDDVLRLERGAVAADDRRRRRPGWSSGPGRTAA